LGNESGLVRAMEASTFGSELAVAFLVFKVEMGLEIVKCLIGNRFVTPHVSTAEAKTPVSQKR
jgi:hypothetical protein